MYIYKTTNTVNDKIYIGQSTKEYNNTYLGSGKKITRAIKKYGKENFIKQLIEHCEFYEIDDKECYWINKFDSTNEKIGYNILEGGQYRLNTNLPKSTRDLISSSLKTYYSIPINLEKQKSSYMNRNLLGEKNGMYGNGYKIAGKLNGRFGGAGTTTKTREKIRKAATGRVVSEKSKEKMSINNKGEKNPMHGKSSFDIWVEKFGIEEAERRKILKINKIKETFNNKRIAKANIVDSFAISDILI